MNEFNTKLIELLERIAGSIQCQPDERVIELFKELKEMNEQEIKQEQAIKPFLQSCPLHDLHKHDKELVAKVCDKVRKWCKNIREWTYDSSHRVLDLHNLDEFLKQIKKEFEDE